MRYCRYRNQIPSAGNPEVAKVFPSGWSGRDCSFLCFIHYHDFCLSDFRFPVLLKSSLSQSSSKKMIRVVNNHKHYHNFTWLHILLSFAMFPVFELTYQAVKCIFFGICIILSVCAPNSETTLEAHRYFFDYDVESLFIRHLQSTIV